MKPDEPAFPFNVKIPAMFNGSGETTVFANSGLTKRELFAALAMQGYCANTSAWVELDHKAMGEHSVLAADALIKALETKDGEG